VDELSAIEKKALEQAAASDDLEVRRKAMEIANAVSEKRKVMTETAKLLLDTKEASRESKFGRTRYWAGTLTPLLAVFLTGATLLMQTWQYQSSAKLQVDANEDSQWRDAIKNVSMRDTGTTLISAFAMRTFFDSSHYSLQARTVAATLLPHVDNPDGFDNVFFDMLDDNSKPNQAHIVAIAKTIFNSQLDLYHVNVLASQPVKLEFATLKEILGEDDPPTFIQQDPASRKQAVASAWMLDSVSDGLHDLWVSKNGTPQGMDLGGVVLEFGQFDGLDFSRTNLRGGALYHSDFKGVNFTGASFTRKLISNVTLDGADLKGVTDFEESRWEYTNWWKAKCLSPELLAYLEKNDSTATLQNRHEAHSVLCQ
jgi:hypothetical protein